MVPVLTGLSVQATLLFAGLGTLLLHFVSRGKVPAFLGSSFAFIAGYAAIAPNGEAELLPYACLGVACAGLLYLVLGYKPVADYLLLPHYAGGARWAVLSATIAGGFASYLWYNAEPSQVLMGDAGSRMLGLAIGIAVLAAGNPLLIFVFAPVIFADGGTGLVKVLLLRLFKKLGFDITPPSKLTPEKAAEQNIVVRSFHSIRFPLHDHCRYVKNWSRPQILIRFVIMQAFLIPLLFAIFTKVR